ncbi:MAG: glycosyltransferase [Desulfovibrionaceae bacterium]|nr:glycosyltransferase [Desulfovibrionaceae bacterium]
MIRVLVVLPFYGGSLPVGRFCVEALRDNGCLVDVFEAPAFYPAFQALKGLKVRQDRLDFLENSYLRVVGEAVLAQADRFQPDLILALAQAPLGIPTLKRLKSAGIPTAMWFVEDYRLFTYWRVFAPHYDIFAVIQKEPFLEELAKAGVRGAFYLPLAAQPSLHRPLELTTTEKRSFGADLSFMGAGYPNRRLAFRRLTAYNFKIWGTEWEGEAALAGCLQMEGRRISPEETVRIFNAAKINLNLHSGTRREEAVTHGDFVNPRTFEIAACGAFQLVDRRTLMPELFADGELAVFDSLEELTDKIEHALAHPEERAAMAGRARERVLREHTYAHRMRVLLEFAAALPGWPRPRTDSGLAAELANLPGDLRNGLAELLQSLELPPATDFETLIAALRSRSGVLSPLECALLFLDEWRKQYRV